MTKSMKFVAVGIDHRHIYGQIQHMQNVGGEFVAWWTEGGPETLEGFLKRFPDVPRIDDLAELLADESVELVLIADIPKHRAQRAIDAMRAGKDVMVDKPGCTTLEQLEAIEQTVSDTGRIWSIDFSERFEVASVTKAAELVAEGAIGRVIQTAGMGPHRLNHSTRPDWFFDRESYGGILCDIASHQIDQFLYFTNSTDAEITLASAENYANPDNPGLQDFGEIALRSSSGHGYIRVDWYTPNALPTWGDGRLTILGTEGYIELRKYVDITGTEGIDHLYLVNGDVCQKIDCSDAGYPYFQRVFDDIRSRTETAMTQKHAFKVMELAIKAQLLADNKASIA